MTLTLGFKKQNMIQFCVLYKLLFLMQFMYQNLLFRIFFVITQQRDLYR
jgi:hypothetical protein